MCGIAGAVSLDPSAQVDGEIVRLMTQSLTHRGPDGEGFWRSPSGRAALGHRRLAIIDLVTGQQPMTTSGGDITVSFNGEIYNYRELMEDLKAEGVTFRTTSDTEVLLHLYARDGMRFLDKLRGMFAFVVWDEPQQRLIIARDRIGKKPLYYTQVDGIFYFASSLEALSKSSPRRPAVDLRALDDFLTLSYIPAPRTIFAGVNKLPAGCAITVTDSGVHTERYWTLEGAVQPYEGSFTSAIDRLDEMLGTAVSQRLRSDVPLGLFLSGGVDSSLVAAVAARQSDTAVQTFTVGFDDHRYDETRFAQQVATHLNTQHHVLNAQPAMLDLLPHVVRGFGEPFGDATALANWVLARTTRCHVTVALSGDGGDEGFGGYPWYGTATRLTRLRRWAPRWLLALGATTLDRIASSSPAAQRLRRGLDIASLTDAGSFARLRSFMDNDVIHHLYGDDLPEARRESITECMRTLERLYEGADGSNLRRLRYVDVHTYLAECLMPKVDVSSMAHGLEVRAPLLDHELVEYAMTLPDHWLLGPNGGKRILKALASRYLPERFLARPKQGFTIPLNHWFSGSQQSRIDKLAKSEPLLASGWVNSAGITALGEAHRRGLRDYSQQLYNLVVLDEWLRQQ